MTTTSAPPEPTVVALPPRSRRRRVARWIAFGVGLGFVFFAVVLASQVGNDPSYRGGKVLNKPAPSLDLPLLAGGNLTSAQLAGKAVIINFWNSWCIPCQRELPALKAFAAEHRDDPSVVMVGIVRDDTTDAVRAYVAEQGITWNIALDPGARAALDYGTTGQPETYAISPEGIVVAQQFGEVTTANLETMLRCAKGRC